MSTAMRQNTSCTYLKLENFELAPQLRLVPKQARIGHELEPVPGSNTVCNSSHLQNPPLCAMLKLEHAS